MQRFLTFVLIIYAFYITQAIRVKQSSLVNAQNTLTSRTTACRPSSVYNSLPTSGDNDVYFFNRKWGSQAIVKNGNDGVGAANPCNSNANKRNAKIDFFRGSNAWLLRQGDYYLKRDASHSSGLSWVKNTNPPTDSSYDWALLKSQNHNNEYCIRSATNSVKYIWAHKKNGNNIDVKIVTDAANNCGLSSAGSWYIGVGLR